ncbi:type 1 glutamine amidotransferase domain-containing protein [Corynebacterium sp. LK2510]|uniref:type 1 glutamine amidotransferase domain-containing protein n=1 Tax=Corynebacterium sp. LK2510 TaxID=3110472 RepID=UPI0034CF86F2
MTRVLFVLSAADHWTLNDGTRHPTGFWAEEFATPYRIFSEAGWDLTVATPGGEPAVVDKVSLADGAGEPETLEAVKRTLDELAQVLESPESLESVNAADFDLVFYPGGHGPMEDLATDTTSAAILEQRLQADAPLALLCHAPAAVLATADTEGTSPFVGRAMTGFTNEEERAGGLAEKAPWLLEDRLIELGVDFTKADEPFAPRVVVDGTLYTGQNPASSAELATRLVEDLMA